MFALIKQEIKVKASFPRQSNTILNSAFGLQKNPDNLRNGENPFITPSFRGQRSILRYQTMHAKQLYVFEDDIVDKLYNMNYFCETLKSWQIPLRGKEITN